MTPSTTGLDSKLQPAEESAACKVLCEAMLHKSSMAEVVDAAACQAE